MNYVFKFEKGFFFIFLGKWNGMNDGMKGFLKKDFGIMILFIFKIIICLVFCMLFFVIYNLKLMIIIL